MRYGKSIPILLRTDLLFSYQDPRIEFVLHNFYLRPSGCHETDVEPRETFILARRSFPLWGSFQAESVVRSMRFFLLFHQSSTAKQFIPYDPLLISYSHTHYEYELKRMFAINIYIKKHGSWLLLYSAMLD